MKLNQEELYVALAMLAGSLESDGHAGRDCFEKAAYVHAIRDAVGNALNPADCDAAQRVRDAIGGEIPIPAPQNPDLIGFQPFEQRVIVEYKELEAKIDALCNFLNDNEKVSRCTVEQLNDLSDQHRAMLAYQDILAKRIGKFERKQVQEQVPQEQQGCGEPVPDMPVPTPSAIGQGKELQETTGGEWPPEPNPKESLIMTAKGFRQDLDGTLQLMKALRDELCTPGVSLEGIAADPREVVPNLVLSIRHVEDGIMRMGMFLKAVGNPTPYPKSYDPTSPVVEPTADGLTL